MRIEFDDEKDASNREKHGVTLADAKLIDWSAVIAKEDTRKEYSERREIGLGSIGHRLYCVVYTQRGDTLRIISLRKANRREVRIYEKATQTG